MSTAGYAWRELTSAQRGEWLLWRKIRGHPWHSPQHRPSDGHHRFHLTAACYEHHPVIGRSPERMGEFALRLLETLTMGTDRVLAWCLLPNHYHVLVETPDVVDLLVRIGRLHGRTSHAWNGEDEARGRKVFFRAVERAIRSERHCWATLNYIHHNPVRHNYVPRWIDWPWSSAADYLRQTSPGEARRIWEQYPILDYGRGWDDPEK